MVGRGGRNEKEKVGCCQITDCLCAFLKFLELFLEARRILKGENGII